MSRLSLIFGFVNKFQNQIERIDFDINSNEEKQIAGIVQIKPKCKPKRNEKLFNKTKNKFFI